MPPRKIKCQVLDMKWLTPTVMELRFAPEKPFNYEPGQFASLVVPSVKNVVSLERRMYSFASPCEEAKLEGYRLCVKFNENGLGSMYIASLRAGQMIDILAPFGDFIYEPHRETRNVCFISTGTGIAPLRSMVLSKELASSAPLNTTFLYGCRDEREILYPELSKKPNIEVVHAVSKPLSGWQGFTGRVTDYIQSLSRDWPWHRTEFYICGSPQMAMDVTILLTHTKGVSLRAIHQEVFAAPGANTFQIKNEIKRAAA